MLISDKPLPNKIEGGHSLKALSWSIFFLYVGISSLQYHSYLFERLGFAAVEIGSILTLGYAAGIISPLFQLWILSKHSNPRYPLLGLSVLAALAVFLLPYQKSVIGAGLVYFFYMFATSGIFPLNTAHVFQLSRSRGHGAFFKVRGLGTLAFCLGCFASALGALRFEFSALYSLFAAAFLVSALFVLFSPKVLDTLTPQVEIRENLFVSLRRMVILLWKKPMRQILIPICVLGLANGLSVPVQSNYLAHSLNVGKAAISLSWAWASLWEIPLMLLCGHWIMRYGLKPLLLLGFGGTVLRLILWSYASEPWTFAIALSLHGCYYAGVISAFGVFIDKNYEGSERHRIQVVAGLFYGGFVTSIGAFSSGILWEYFSLRWSFISATIVACLASLLLLPWLLKSSKTAL